MLRGVAVACSEYGRLIRSFRTRFMRHDAPLSALSDCSVLRTVVDNTFMYPSFAPGP